MSRPYLAFGGSVPSRGKRDYSVLSHDQFRAKCVCVFATRLIGDDVKDAYSYHRHVRDRKEIRAL